jgi:hypothetical protein
MINDGAIIRTFLLTKSVITNLVGSDPGARLYYGPALPPGYTPATGAAILFNRRGGGQSYDSGLLTPSMQYLCYGSTLSITEQLYRALYSALNDQGGLGVKQSRLEMPGQPLQEADTGWLLVMCAYKHWLGNG